MRYDSIRFDSIRFDRWREEGRGGEERWGTDERGEAHKGTFEFSRGDWAGVSCAKQETKDGGKWVKRRRGCIRRDLIRDSRHLNSLFRLLDTATFVACVPRLRCSSSAGCFSPTFLRPSYRRILDVKKKIRKKEGRKEGGERTIERGSESRDFLSVRVSSTSSFFLFAFFPPSARTLPRTADFPPLHVHHLDEINPDPLKSWMLMEAILDLSS